MNNPRVFIFAACALAAGCATQWRVFQKRIDPEMAETPPAQAEAAIGEFTAANPDAGEKLKTRLSAQMDKAHKRLVRMRAGRPKPEVNPAAV